MGKNVIETYIEKQSQLIILISGFSGSGKTVLGKSLSKDFKIDFLNLNDYMVDEFDKTIDLGDIKVVDWDSPDAVDWNKFNVDVNIKKNKGVIVSGFAFPIDKLDFKTDFHIHLKISKDDLLHNRREYIAENEDSRLKELGDDLEKRILNKVSYPHYLESLKTSKIDKFIVVESGKLKEVYDQLFDYVIKEVEKVIYRH